MRYSKNFSETEQASLQALQAAVQPWRERVLNHAVYERLESLPHIVRFMECHVFAVWDFMSQLKALQRLLTCTSLPWLPQGDSLSRRLINEIVLAEESDEVAPDQYLSHFELYLKAMTEAGARTQGIESLIARLAQRHTLLDALEDYPEDLRYFLQTNWRLAQSGAAHRIAAAFTLGREQIIPEMFARLVSRLAADHPQLQTLKFYFERHISLDGDLHSPMALRMLVRLCGEDAERWREASESAVEALQARLRLWDAVVESLGAARALE